MKRKYKILITIGVIIIVIRIILPYVVLHYANKKLANMDGYYGHIDDIDLNLYRGAYVINDIYLNTVDSVSGAQTPFFSAAEIDLSVEWAALFDGSIVGELVFYSPKLAFTKGKAEPADVAADTTTFKTLLDDLMPLRINRFEVNDGRVHYVDSSATPVVDVYMEKMHILALNLTNVTDADTDLPSTVTAEAHVYDGTLTFNMKLDALADQPTFDMNLELSNTNLVLLNDFLQAYGNFDVNQGTFGLYTEMAAEEGRFVGYVKPLIRDLDVVGPEDRSNSLLNKFWESIVGGTGEVFENQQKDQVATKLELEGSFNNPKARVFDAIWEILSNAFIQALMPTIDNEISIQSVDSGVPEEGGFFNRMFSSDKEQDKGGDKGEDKGKKDK